MKSDSIAYSTRLASITAIVTILFGHISSSLASCSTTRPTSPVDDFITLTQESNFLSALLVATVFSIAVGLASLGLSWVVDRLKEFEGGLISTRIRGAIGRRKERFRPQTQSKSFGDRLVGCLPEELQRIFQDQRRAVLQQNRSPLYKKFKITQLFLSSVQGAVIAWIISLVSSNRIM